MTIALAYTPEDDYFGAPFFDADEERQSPHPHRFVHGGFAGTDTRFSFYFPPKALYRGRFFTSVEGGPGGHENRAAAMGETAGLHGMDFAFAYGAYLVESNGGHIAPPGAWRGRSKHDGAITTYRATAESTRLARALAGEIYGASPRFGYIFGPSGGAWRTILCIENTRGIWHGAAPYISPAGHGISFPAIISNLVRVLGGKIADVAAAFEPGGSGDPFATLNSRQRAELAAAYRAGLQPGSEFQLLGPAVELNVLLTTSEMHADYDPNYFTDFWRAPGYAGADGELAGDLVDARTAIAGIVSKRDVDSNALAAILPTAPALPADAVIGIRIGADAPAGLLRGCDVEAANARFVCLGAIGDVAVLDQVDPAALAQLRAGDRVRIQNRRYLAYCNSFRHQIDPDAPECAQFMIAGKPIYPQRALNVADVLAGVRTTGRFETKVLYLSNTLDTLASPLGGTVTWAGQARAALGARAHEQFRVWINERGGHVSPARRTPGAFPVVDTRLVDTTGIVESALADLVAWVEDGAPPPEDTRFEVAEGRIVLPASAAERKGIQPVVTARANGLEHAQARAGEAVALAVSVDIPPRGGEVFRIEWDFDGTGAWPVRHEGPGAPTTQSHVFAKPGTYYPAVRVTTRRAGPAPYGEIRNLARVRVDVA